jgi:hypothetical protein
LPNPAQHPQIGNASLSVYSEFSAKARLGGSKAEIGIFTVIRDLIPYELGGTCDGVKNDRVR